MLPPVCFCSFVVCRETEEDDIWSSCSAFPCFLGFFSGFCSSSPCSQSPASSAFFSSSVSSLVRGEGGAPWVTCFLLYGLLWLTREWRRAPLFLLEETGAQILLFPGSVSFFFFSVLLFFSPPIPPVFLSLFFFIRRFFLFFSSLSRFSVVPPPLCFFFVSVFGFFLLFFLLTRFFLLLSP